jgi:hypothetical protein
MQVIPQQKLGIGPFSVQPYEWETQVDAELQPNVHHHTTLHSSVAFTTRSLRQDKDLSQPLSLLHGAPGPCCEP